MRLNQYLKEEKEDRSSFLTRTYWSGDLVFVYEKERNVGQCKVWNKIQAREYLMTLPPETENLRPHNPKASTPAPNHLLKVEYETVGEDPEGYQWIDTQTGLEVNRIGKVPEMERR